MDSRAKLAVRRAFEQAATGYDQAAFLQREIARRQDEHLEGIKLDPQRILDAGCGTGLSIPLLRSRYPQAGIIALDLAEGMLRQTMLRYGRPNDWWRWFSRLSPPASRLTPLCADIERLPLAQASVDLIWPTKLQQ